MSRAEIDKNRCSVCKTPLDLKRELTEQEFVVMRGALRDVVWNLVKSYRGGSEKELRGLSDVVGELEHNIRDDWFVRSLAFCLVYYLTPFYDFWV